MKTIAAELKDARDLVAVANQRLTYEQELSSRKKRMARPNVEENRGLLVIRDFLSEHRLKDLLESQDQGCTGGELEAAINAIAWLERAAGEQVTQRCRKCGCTELAACGDGCWWVEPDLCSSCAPKPAVEKLRLKKKGGLKTRPTRAKSRA